MNRAGFTLIEVLVAIILVGLAVVALVGANTAFTSANGLGAELSTAEFLIEQIRELTTTLPVIDPETETAVFGPEEASLSAYDDIDDFNGSSFSPPIAGNRSTLNDFSSYRQTVQVENVSKADFEQVVTNHTSDFVRVTVKVYLGTKLVSTAQWIRVRL